MGSAQGTGGACRSSGDGDIIVIEHQHHAFAFDVLDRDRHHVRQAVLRMGVDDVFVNRFGQLGKQLCFQPPAVLDPLVQLPGSCVGRRAHADNTDQVFRTGTLVVLLDAAVEQGENACAAPDVQPANAGGAVKRVGGEAKQVHSEFLHVDGNDADGIDGIGVKNDFLFPGDLPDFLDRLDGSGFVVAVHDRHENGFIGDGFCDILRIHPALFVHRNGSHSKSHRLEPAHASDNRVVLDVGNNDVLALFCVGHGHTLDGVVHRLGPPGGEHYLFGDGCIDQPGHRPARGIQYLGGLLTAFMLAGRVEIVVIDGIDHRCLHLRQQRFEGNLVQIDDVHGFVPATRNKRVRSVRISVLLPGSTDTHRRK